MIYNVNIRKVENGYLLTYNIDGKSKDRVFLTWTDLCNWLLEQQQG